MDKTIIDILIKCKIFDGADKKDIPKIIRCLNTSTKKYSKGEIIFNEGDKAGLIGIVLSGNVQIVKDDFYGNRNLIAVLSTNDIFAEAYACAEVESLPVSAIAATDAEILFLDYRKITQSERSCNYHHLIMGNLLKIVSNKNIMLNEKAQITSKRTTREKIMAYLSTYAKKSGSSEFHIPLNRQELADYLCVERSAMSAELGRLKADGKLQTKKNYFKLM